ncbi:MAG: hypothetical protein J1E32_07650, partial [Treponema sp.]|nr:hypothetical protein [Treponema sp.]
RQNLPAAVRKTAPQTSWHVPSGRDVLGSTMFSMTMLLALIFADSMPAHGRFVNLTRDLWKKSPAEMSAFDFIFHIKYAKSLKTCGISCRYNV